MNKKTIHWASLVVRIVTIIAMFIVAFSCLSILEKVVLDMVLFISQVTTGILYHSTK